MYVCVCVYTVGPVGADWRRRGDARQSGAPSRRAQSHEGVRGWEVRASDDTSLRENVERAGSARDAV